MDITQKLAETPEYAAVRAKLDALDNITVASPGLPGEAVAVWLEEAIDDGDITTETLLEQARAAVLAAHAHDAAEQAISRVRAVLEDKRRSIANSDTVFEIMAAELAQIVDAAAALAPFDAILTAESAIRAGRVAAYTAVQELGQRYTNLRVDQLKIMRDRTSEPDPRHALALFVADPLSAFGDYDAWIAGGAVTPPWPLLEPESSEGGWTVAATGRRTFVNDASAPAFLLWAIESGVELVVPTMANYARVAARLSDPWRDADEETVARHHYASGQTLHESGHINLGADA